MLQQGNNSRWPIGNPFVVVQSFALRPFVSQRKGDEEVAFDTRKRLEETSNDARATRSASKSERFDEEKELGKAQGDLQTRRDVRQRVSTGSARRNSSETRRKSES